MGPWPRFYQVTIISDGHSGGAAHTDRQISLKAQSRLKNGSGRAGEHLTTILAVEKPLSGLLATVD
jgi:hypothetical protein